MSLFIRVTRSIPRRALEMALVCLVASPIAAQEGDAPAAQATDTSGFERVVLTAGRSTVLSTPFDVTRIAVTNPAVADATVVRASRGVDRRQERRNGQPDCLGWKQPPSVPTSWSIPA